MAAGTLRSPGKRGMARVAGGKSVDRLARETPLALCRDWPDRGGGWRCACRRGPDASARGPCACAPGVPVGDRRVCKSPRCVRDN